MSTLTALKEQNVLVDATEREQAREALKAADGHLESFEIGTEARSRRLPPELADVLSTVIETLARGGSITIGSLPEELTTSVAAAQLGVSRPTLMKLIRSGELRAHMVGSHHRVKLADVREFQRQRLEAQKAAFTDLRDLLDENGFDED